MKKLALLLFPIVLVSQFSLGPQELVPQTWMNTYQDVKSLVSLFSRSMEQRQQPDATMQPAEHTGSCPEENAESAKVFAYAWPVPDTPLPQIKVSEDMSKVVWVDPVSKKFHTVVVPKTLSEMQRNQAYEELQVEMQKASRRMEALRALEFKLRIRHSHLPRIGLTT